MGHISFWFMLMALIYCVKTNIIKKNKGVLLDACKEDGPEVNAEKTK
jgi:hypothetical protein